MHLLNEKYAAHLPSLKQKIIDDDECSKHVQSRELLGANMKYITCKQFFFNMNENQHDMKILYETNVLYKKSFDDRLAAKRIEGACIMHSYTLHT